MSGRRVIVWMFVCFIFFPLVTGCLHLREKGIVEEPCVKELGPEDYPIETERLLDVAVSHPEESHKIDAHLQLGRMYTNFDNPDRDYKKATLHFEKYIVSEPKSTDQQEARNWLAVLKELERRTRKIEERDALMLDLKKEKKAFSHRVDHLNRENHDLNDKIEKLKDLEIRYEKKKRHYR